MKELLIALLLGTVIIGCVAQGGTKATPAPQATAQPTVAPSDQPPAPPVDSGETQKAIDAGISASQEQPPSIPDDELGITAGDLGA